MSSLASASVTLSPNLLRISCVPSVRPARRSLLLLTLSALTVMAPLPKTSKASNVSLMSSCDRTWHLSQERSGGGGGGERREEREWRWREEEVEARDGEGGNNRGQTGKDGSTAGGVRTYQSHKLRGGSSLEEEEEFAISELADISRS